MATTRKRGKTHYARWMKSDKTYGEKGGFKTKAEAAQQLQNAGFRVVEGVTKATNYLVAEDGKSSSKRLKAEEYNIPIIYDLIDFLNKVKT